MIHPKQKVRVCVRLIFVLVWGTYYVPATYMPGISQQTTVWYQVRTYKIALHPKINRRVFDYVAAAVLAADADAAVLVATMTPPYVRQKRLLAG